MLRSAFVFALSSLLLAGCAQAPKMTEPTSGPFRVGTGVSTGVYYRLGQAICQYYRTRVDVEKSACAAQEGSSVANLNDLRNRDLEFALVHSEWVKEARRGTSRFTDSGPMRDLRAVASFYAEPLSIVVKRDSEISGLKDLQRARVAWVPRSGAAYFFRVVMAAKDWQEQDFTSLQTVRNTRAAMKAFCEDRVDVMLTASGHPSLTLHDALLDCDGRMLQITDDDIAEEVTGHLSLSLAEVPPGTYLGQPQAIATFGSRPVLVTRADVPDDLVRAVSEAIFEDLESFKRQRPSFATLSPEQMVSASIAVPLHPAAKAYFQEKGLLP